MSEGREGAILKISGDRLRCPFCDGADQIVEIVGDDETKFCYQVLCECSARGPEVGWIRDDIDGIAEAVRRWEIRK